MSSLVLAILVYHEISSILRPLVDIFCVHVNMRCVNCKSYISIQKPITFLVIQEPAADSTFILTQNKLVIILFINNNKSFEIVASKGKDKTGGGDRFQNMEGEL